MSDDQVYDDTTIGVQWACVRECFLWQCPEDCPCGCEDCDGDPGRRVDTIDPGSSL